MNKIILFDIDYTLVNTDRIKKECEKKLIIGLNTSKSIFQSVIKNYVISLKSSTDFNPNSYLKILSKYYKKDFIVLEKIFFDANIFSKALYSDTKSTLEFLNKDYSLGVFTQGFKYFQNQKLDLGKIDKYFDKKYVYIFRRKMTKDVIRKLPSSIVVEDNLKNAEVLSRNKRFKIYWLNRKDEKSHRKIPTIFSLKDLLST